VLGNYKVFEIDWARMGCIFPINLTIAGSGKIMYTGTILADQIMQKNIPRR
jgi:hypothetical protein